MRKLWGLALLLACWPVCLAQDEAKEWRGLTLGETTPEEVRSELGEPDKVKENQKLQTEARRWIDRGRRYYRMEYKDQEGMKKIRLYFHQDRLAVIEFEPDEKIKARSQLDRYGMRLLPLVRGLVMTSTPEEWEPVNQYREVLEYPPLYHLLGVGLEAYVDITVAFDGLLQNLAKSTGGAWGGDFTPGRVMKVQLMARWLVQ